MKLVEVEWKGRKQTVPAVRRGLELWFHLEGETHFIEMESTIARAASGGKSHADGEYVAPMPGKIMKVLVSQGEKVEQGQSLLVMEAMKMEYSIEADFNGVVTELSVKVDQQVALGDLLVKVEKE